MGKKICDIYINFGGWQTDSLFFWCVHKLGNLMVHCSIQMYLYVFHFLVLFLREFSMKFVLHVGADSFLYELVAFTQCALLFCNFISKTEHIFDVYLSINQDECTNTISIPFNRFETPSLHQGNKQPSWPITKSMATFQK